MPEAAAQTVYYAGKFGWRVAPFTLLLEGALDEAYCWLANERHGETKKGLHLLSSNFTVTACGIGDDGGTEGMKERFPFIHRIAAFDAEAGHPPYRFIALFDNDALGQSAYNVMRNANRNLVECHDVFLLQRRYPPTQSDPVALKREIENGNSPWKTLPCEIEDLIERSLLERFVVAYPDCLMRPPQDKNGEYHFDFKRAYKPRLFEFVKLHGDQHCLSRVIETLSALRRYCGLPPDGDAEQVNSRR